MTILFRLFFILTISVFSINPAISAPAGKDSTVNNKKKTENVQKKDSAAGKDETKNKKDQSDKEAKKKARDLANDKIKLEKITETLKFGVQKDRKDAIRLMDRINDEALKKKALDQLIDVIDKEEDIEIKRTAITVAGDQKYKPAIPAIIRALDDPDDDTVISASYALRKMKAMSAKTKLIALLKKRDLTESSNATDSFIITLGELKATELLDFAIKNIDKIETSKMTRERLVLFVGKVGSAAQKDFLLKLYNDDEEDMLIRCYAVTSMGSLKITSARGDIKKRIKEIKSYSFKKRGKYYKLFMNSVATLVKLGDNDSVPLLMDSLRSNNAGVRFKAVNLIKEFDDKRTIDILKYKMKNDPSTKVRRAAKKALKDKGLLDEDKKDKDLATEKKDKK